MRGERRKAMERGERGGRDRVMDERMGEGGSDVGRRGGKENNGVRGEGRREGWREGVN